jgi:hypothetical protein
VPDWHIPDRAELRDAATREAAAEGLRALLSVGAAVEERKRPWGKPGKFDAPAEAYRQRTEPRRADERELVMWLQVAVARAWSASDADGLFGRCSRNVGSFARMVARVLALADACRPAGPEASTTAGRRS